MPDAPAHQMMFLNLLALWLLQLDLRTCLQKWHLQLQLQHAGPPGQIIVVFMHNVASGHEKSLFKPVGPNNTDPGCWSAFAQQCLLITDMTFDETRFDWNKINELALHLIVDAIINAARQTSSYNRRVKSATKQSNGSLQTASPSTRQYCPTSRPASHTCGFQ